ncbi:MAG: mechanosensitive ion channel family protein [Acidimicrobiales bacterium]
MPVQVPAQAVAQETVKDVCGEEASLACRWVFERTASSYWARAADWAIDRPLTILLILVAGVVASRFLRRSVNRFGHRAVLRSGGDITHSRTPQRAGAFTSVLTSLVSGAVWVAVALLVLGQIGITLGPLLAGAGVVGVVLAFGAQHVVADFLSGWFMLTEDQFGVGDVIDLGQVASTPVAGTVERVSLRVTTLRDVHGTVWYVPNSEIHRVANKSQLWSRAVLDVDLPPGADLRRASEVIEQVADDLWHDKSFTEGQILEEPKVLGVERLDAAGASIRLVVKTAPADQWAVARELRLRLAEGFVEAGIETARVCSQRPPAVS